MSEPCPGTAGLLLGKRGREGSAEAELGGKKGLKPFYRCWAWGGQDMESPLPLLVAVRA